MSDAYSQYTKVLFHMDGTNNSTTVPNISYRRLTAMTTVGNNACLKTAQSKFGTASAYFDGNGDYMGFSTHDEYSIATRDFTIEFWVYIINGGHGNASSRMFCIGSNSITGGLYLSCTASDNPCKLILEGYQSSAYFTIIAAGATVSNDTWHHIAIVRSSGVFTLYVDGTAYGTGTPSPAYSISTDGAFYLGGASTVNSFYGYIDEFRFTNYICRYTGNFTAPTAAFDDPDTPTIKVIRHPRHSLAYAKATNAIRVFTFANATEYGLYRVSGTVDRLGVPGSYAVILYNRRTKKPVRRAMSGADGSYQFNHLPYVANGYFAVAYDSNGTPLNAAISDLITPELMP